MLFPTLLLEDGLEVEQHLNDEKCGRQYYTLEYFLTTFKPAPTVFKKVFWNILNALSEEACNGRIQMQMHANSIYIDCQTLDVTLEPDCDVVKIDNPYAEYPVDIRGMVENSMQIAPEEACYNICSVYTPYFKLGQMLSDLINHTEFLLVSITKDFYEEMELNNVFSYICESNHLLRGDNVNNILLGNHQYFNGIKEMNFNFNNIF